MKLFEWDKFEDYESRMTGVENKLITSHFEQLLEDNDWGQDGWSTPEAQFHLEMFKHGWILARMFTDAK